MLCYYGQNALLLQTECLVITDIMPYYYRHNALLLRTQCLVIADLSRTDKDKVQHETQGHEPF